MNDHKVVRALNTDEVVFEGTYEECKDYLSAL